MDSRFSFMVASDIDFDGLMAEIYFGKDYLGCVRLGEDGRISTPERPDCSGTAFTDAEWRRAVAHAAERLMGKDRSTAAAEAGG